MYPLSSLSLGTQQISVGAARIRSSTAQTVPNGSVNTAVALGAVEFADRSVFTVDEPLAGPVPSPTNAITLRKTGYYLISWDASWATNAGQATVLPLIAGSVLDAPATLVLNVSATDIPVYGTSMVIKGIAGQTIGLRAIRSGGAANAQMRAALTVVHLDTNVTHCAKIKALSGQVVEAFKNAVLRMAGEELVSGRIVMPSTGSSSISVTEAGAYAILYQVYLDVAGAGSSALEVLIDDVALTAPEQIIWVNGTVAQCLSGVVVRSLTAGQTVKLRGSASGNNVTMTPSLAVIRLPFNCAKVTATVDQSVAVGVAAVMTMPIVAITPTSTVMTAGSNGITVSKAGRYLLVYNARIGAGNTGLVGIGVLVNDVPLAIPVDDVLLAELPIMQWQTGGNDAVYSKSDVVMLDAGAVVKLRGTNGTSGTAFFAPSLAVIELPGA